MGKNRHHVYSSFVLQADVSLRAAVDMAAMEKAVRPQYFRRTLEKGGKVEVMLETTYKLFLLNCRVEPSDGLEKSGNVP